jgi:hypothetical protein
MRAGVVGEGVGHHRDRAVDLMDRRQPRARLHRIDGAAPVLMDGVAIVVRSEADIEPGMDAGRHAASPAQEAVRHARQRFGADDLDLFHNATL